MSDFKSWKEQEYDIVYDENRDDFVVSLGEEKELARRATLGKAREYVENREARLSKDAKKKFEPVEAWQDEYGHSVPRAVVITSICDNGDAWIKSADGSDRSKVGNYSLDGLRVRDAASLVRVASIKSRVDQIEVLRDQIDTLKKQLVKIDFKKLAAA